MSPRVALAVTLALAATAGAGYFLYSALRKPAPAVTPTPAVEPPRAREAVAVPPVRFTNVTAACGVRFTHHSGAAGDKFLPETMGSGVAAFDYDNDGFTDLFFVNSCPWPGKEPPAGTPKPACQLYRNRGDGTFADVSQDTGLGVTLYGMGAACADVDGDGWTDLVVTAVGGSRLYLNRPAAGGNRRFEDGTRDAGIAGDAVWPKDVTYAAFQGRPEPIPFPASATFLDYDRDGRPDLFICHYVTWSPLIDRSIDAKLTGVGRAYVPPTSFEGGRCRLFRNLGGGKFADVSEAAGVVVTEREGTDAAGRVRNVGKSLGVIAADADADGWPDLLVANDTVRNFLFHNVPTADGKGRRFTEKGLESGVAYAEGRARGGMGIDWGEFRPGKDAAVIANFANEPNTFLCLDNPKKLLFSDGALAVGLAGPSRAPLKFGALFFDFDLDGRLDLLTANGHLEPEIAQVQQSQTYPQPAQLFWNTGSNARLYEPATPATAGPDLFTPLVGRGAAFFDLENDGDPDLVLTSNGGPARVLRNDLPPGKNWVRFAFKGEAIGATLTVEAGGRTYRRQVTAGRGYLSQSELPVTVGLGEATRVDKLTVTWPSPADAKPQVWADLPAGKTHVLERGKP